MKKRILSIMIAAVVIVSMLSVLPFAANAAETSGITGECYWTFDDVTGVLTISGIGVMGTGTWPADQIVEVVIESGVVSIGSNAFRGCTALARVTISESVTTIGGSAFSGCTSLTSVTIPGSVTAIGGFAFSGCTSLTTVNYPGKQAPASVGRNIFSGANVSIYVPADYEGDKFAGIDVIKSGGSAAPTVTITVDFQPMNQGTLEGKIIEALIFEVTVSNGSMPTYQWYQCDDGSGTNPRPVEGADSSTMDIPKDLTVGEYYFYAVASAEGAEPITSRVSTVTVEMPETAQVTTAPEATNPTYSGEAQALVEAGVAEGGKIYYVLGVDAVTAPDTGWTPVVPTATGAGTYYVWYYVKGDTYHLDVAPACVEASIEKVYLTITPKSYTLVIGSSVPNLTAENAYTVEGLVGSDTVNNVELRFVSEPDMTQEGSYTIEVNEETLSVTNGKNYDINCLWGELEVISCVHDFGDFYLGTVNAENDSIFAKCANGCADFGTGAVVITIEAPDNTVYEDGVWYTASLSGYTNSIEPDSEAIVYTKDGQTADPVGVGVFTASYTYGGVTASVTYEVKAATLEAKWGADADNLTYSGTLAEAFDAAENDSSIKYIQLQMDMTTTVDHYIWGGVFTLDLNGKDLTSDTSYALVIKKTGTEVTIKNGDLISNADDCAAISLEDGAKIVLCNGTYKGGNAAVMVLDSSECEIQGGSFACINNYTIINNGVLKISGGTFTDTSVIASDYALVITGGTFDGMIAYYGGYFDLSGNSDPAGIRIDVSVDTDTPDIRLPEGYVLSGDGDTEADNLTYGIYTVILKTSPVTIWIEGNGMATVDKMNYAPGETVTINIGHSSSYSLDELKVYDMDGNEISVRNCQFAMPEGGAVVKVKFIKEIPVPTKVYLSASVSLDGATLSAGSFRFELSYLYEGSVEVIQTVANSADGKVEFAPVLIFSPCNHTFYIKQVALDSDGIEYDTTVYEISLRAVYDKAGELSVITSQNEVEFINAVK